MTSVLLRDPQVRRPSEVFSMEEEVGGIQSLAKEDLGPPEARRGKEGFSARLFRWSMYLLTPCFQTYDLQTVGNQFLLFGAIKFVIICNSRTRAIGANTVFQR